MPLQIVNGIPTVVQELPFDAENLIYKFQLKEQFINNDALDSSITNSSKSGTTYILEYDNESITVVGNNITISSTPNFDLAIGDLIVQGNVVAQISSVTDQTHVSVSDSSGLSNSIATLSQAIHSVDLNRFGDASSKERPVDVDASVINEMVLQYSDDTARASGTTLNVAAIATSDNFVNSTNVITMPETRNGSVDKTSFSVAGDILKVKFFSNINSGQGQVRLKNYKISWQQ